MGSGIHKKTSVYLATLFALIALSACGEKKEAHGPQPADAPKSTTTVEETSGSGGGVPLPPPVPPGDQGTPGTPAPAPSATPVQDPGNLKDPLEDGYEPVDPNSVEKADFQKRYTGMDDGDGLLYTGTSTDYLLTYLRLRNEDPNLDPGVKARNLEAAQSIRSAHFSRDEDGNIAITLKIKEGAYLKTYVLAGGLNDGDTVSNLRLAKGRNGVKTNGQQSISGKIKCMDVDGGCETMFARLVIENQVAPVPANGGSSRAAVAIVFRDSLADIHASLSPSDDNPEYESMRRFWINSATKANTDHKMEKVVLKSYEIVNGRSGFDVQIIGVNRQLISLGGALLAPETGTSVNLSADMTPDMQEINDLDNITGYQLDLANFISSAKIINNNGLGQVRLVLKMRKRGGYSQEAFKLTIMRIINPILTPNEENLNFK